MPAPMLVVCCPEGSLLVANEVIRNLAADFGGEPDEMGTSGCGGYE